MPVDVRALAQAEQTGANPQESCKHYYVSIHQPGMPVYWIRQCSLCGHFDADDLRKQIADATLTRDQQIREHAEAIHRLVKLTSSQRTRPRILAQAEVLLGLLGSHDTDTPNAD